jgi:hypothetical protein
MRKQMLASFLAAILAGLAAAQTNQRPSLLITGQVLDADGQPVSGARVYAYPVAALEGRLPSASSDKEGKFSIAVEQTGKFLVAISKAEEGYPNTYSAFYNQSASSLPEVAVEVNQPPPSALIRLGPKSGKLTGQVLDAENGWPVSQVQISLCRVEAPAYCHRTSADVPGQRFQFLAPNVPFTIQVSAPGYMDWYGEGGAGSQAEVMQVEPGTTRELNVRLRKITGGENQSVLRAPEQLSPINGAEFHKFPRVTKLEWSAVPGAVSYTVEIQFCEASSAEVKECKDPQPLQNRHIPPPSGIRATSYEFPFIGAQPGRWRVWAVDAEGRAGAKSAWSLFTYTY